MLRSHFSHRAYLPVRETENKQVNKGTHTHTLNKNVKQFNDLSLRYCDGEKIGGSKGLLELDNQGKTF